MSTLALAELALPRTSADRRRWLLVCAACAATVTLVLAGVRILRFPVSEGADDGSYASYIQESGLRGGTLFGVLLCCIPPLVLLIQALRVGSTARERRLGAVRAAGASRRQLRTLATLEGATAGLCGGLLGVAGYVLLGRATLNVPTVYLRIVPTADRLDLVVVPIVLFAIATLAGLSAGLSARDVVAAPQRVNLRTPRPLPGRRGIVAVALLAGAVLGLSGMPWLYFDALLGVVIALFVALVFVGAPYLVLAAAWRLHRSADPMRQLAAARLRADPRSPGRVVAVVAACGATFYVGSMLLVDILRGGVDHDPGFFVSGAALALGGALIALVVSVLSLIVAAAEQLLDGRRATSVLAAFGVSTSDLRRALRRQLTAPTGLAAAVGAGLAAVAMSIPYGLGLLPFAVVGVAAATVPALLAAWLATAFLGPQLADATSAENLRTA